MAGTVHEWYGYVAADSSLAAAEGPVNAHCPFVDGLCKKHATGGVCSVSLSGSPAPVIICPLRLYFGGHDFLKEIAQHAFSSLDVHRGQDGKPSLTKGSSTALFAAEQGKVAVGVFGQGWDKEIQLPPSLEGGASYKVDFTLIAVSPEGDLLGFAPIEVQTIDTTNNYKASVAGLKDHRKVISSTVGLNWENVSKRILPQLIVKGLMLQGERLCTHGIYFVTPEPVFDKIAKRLGGFDRLREIPNQPGSITFVRYAYNADQNRVDGKPLDLFVKDMTTISTSDMSIAFISPLNLPKAGSYETKLRAEIADNKRP